MSKDTAGHKGSSERNVSEGSEATRNILQDVCLDFESIDVAPRSNKIGVIKNVKKPSVQQQENSGTSSFKITDASSHQVDSGNSSFKVTDSSSHQVDSGNSSFKVTDASSHHEDSGNSSFKVTDASSDSVVNIQTNSTILTVRNEGQLRTANQNNSSSVSLSTDVGNAPSNIPTSSALPTNASSNLTVTADDLAAAKNLSSLAQLADAEIVRSGDNVSIIVTNPRLIKVLTEAGAITELQPALIESQLGADEQLSIVDPDVLESSVFQECLEMADNSIAIEEEVVSESSSSRSETGKTPKRIFSNSGRFPKKALASQPCYAPSTPASRARRVTTRMKAAWSRLLEMDGHLVCQMPGCSQTFVTVANFTTHYKFCSGKKTLKKCDYCESMIFSTPKAMLQHMEVEHPDKVEEYKATHQDTLIEQERSNSPSQLLVSEDENVAMNLEEVTHQPLKNSRKRKLSPKENIVPRKKVILKHKLQSIQNSMAENANEFKKCVRFDSITDKINAIEEACNFETPTGSDEHKKGRKKRHSFIERIVAEKKYFVDDEDVDGSLTPKEEMSMEEKLSLRERNHTKARMLLNLDRYKRYQEYLTVTRDWSSERRTYSRSRCSEASAENSFENSYLAHLQNESFEDSNQLNNVVDSSTISMPTPEAEITEIQLTPAELQQNSETYQVLETGQFVSVIPIAPEPTVSESSVAITSNSDSLQTTSNPADPLALFSSPSEIRVKREKTACYNRVNFETPKQKPKLGIITYGLKVPNEEINKPVEPPITFDSLVNSMLPKSAKQNSQAGTDKIVLASADVNKTAKESEIKVPTKSPPNNKKRGGRSKIKTEPTDLKDSKTSKNKAVQNHSGKKYSAAMLKTIETNLKNKKVKLFGVKKNSKFKSKESNKHSKNLKAKNIRMRQTKRNMPTKKTINRTKKSCKTKSVDNSTILCQENIDNHLPLGQGADNISQIPCLAADHSYTQAGVAVINSVTEDQAVVNASTVVEEIEVSTSNTENLLQSVSDKIESPSVNVQTEQIASETEAVKNSVVPDSVNNSAEVAPSLPFDKDAATKDLSESGDGSVQKEQIVSEIQAVKDAAVPDSQNSSAEIAQSLPVDNDVAKKDVPGTVDNSVSNVAEVERMDTCIEVTSQLGKSSVDDSERSTEKNAQNNLESDKSMAENIQNNEDVLKSMPENISNDQDAALNTTITSEITVDKESNQSYQSLAAEEKKSEEVTSEQLHVIQNANSEAPDLSADKYIQSNLIKNDSSLAECSAPTLVRENESYDQSAKSVEEQIVVPNEKETSSQKSETPLPEVPVKRGRGRPRKSTNKTPPTVSKHDNLKKDKPDKSLVITDAKDNQTDAKHSTDQKLVVDDGDSTPVRKSERIKKRKVMSDEMFETPLAEAKLKGKKKEVTTPKQKEEVTVKQKEDVTLEQEEEVAPKQKEEATPEQNEKATPKQKEKATPKQKDKATPKQKEKATPKQKEKATTKQKEKVTSKQSEEVTPTQKEEATPSTPASQAKRRGRPRKYPVEDSPMELVSPVDNKENEGQKMVEIEPGAVDENQRKYSRKGRPRKCVRYADLNSGLDSSESLDESNSPNAGKDKSESQKSKGVDKSGNVDENKKDIIESINGQEEEIVLPLKKRKQRQSKKNDDLEVEILESSNHTIDKSDQLRGKEKKSEEENDEPEELSMNLRQKRKRKRAGSSDEEWDPAVHIKTRQGSRKSQADVIEAEESSEDYDSDVNDRSISRPKKTETLRRSIPKGTPSSQLSHGLLLKYSLETFGEVLTEYKPLKSMWKLLSNEEYILPPFKTSAYFKIEKTWDKSEAYWQSLDLFDSAPFDKNSCHGTFFTGGPATCSAWCPVPVDGNNVQYVALAVSYAVDKVHPYAFDKSERGLLQLWNVGDLRNKRLETRPLMELSILHEFAPINDMKWCPYGCWENPTSELSDDVLPRLGLLALACADSFVRIYSIPHPNYLPKQGTCYPIYTASPSIILEPMHGDICNVTKKSMCISLAWQKSDGCERVAAGYGSGMICVWRLNSLSTILATKENNQTILSPYLIFIGHGTPVLGLSFAPLPGGRFLVSSSIDKPMKFWDLLDTSMPFHTFKKGAGRSAEWSNIYCGAFGTFELGLSNFKGPTYFKECGTETFPNKTLSNLTCSALKSAFSEWLNATAIIDISGSVSVSVSFICNMLPEHQKSPSYLHRFVYQSELQPVEGINEKIAFLSYTENADCISTLQLMTDVAFVVNKMIQMVCEGISPDSHTEKQVVKASSQKISGGLTDDQYRELSGNVNSLMTIEQMKEVISVVHEITENCEPLAICNESCDILEITEEAAVEIPSNDSSDSLKEEDSKKEKARESELQSSVSNKLSEITDIVTLVTDIKDVTYTVEEVTCDSSIGSDDLVMDLDEEPVQNSSSFNAEESETEYEIINIAPITSKDTVPVSSDVTDLLNNLIDTIESNETASCLETDSQISTESRVHENTVSEVYSDSITCVSVVDEMTDVVSVMKDVSEKCAQEKVLQIDTKQISEVSSEQNNIEGDSEEIFTNLSLTELTNKMDEELCFSDSKIIEFVLQKVKDVTSTADDIVEETCKLQNFEMVNNYRDMLLPKISTEFSEEPCEQSSVTNNEKMLHKEIELNYSASEISDVVSCTADMKETFEVVEAIKDAAEVIFDMNDTTTVVSDMNDTTEVLQDVNDTTEVISAVSDTTEVVSDMTATIELVADISDIVDVASDVSQTIEIVLDMKEIVSSIEDMKEVSFVIETVNYACIEDQFLSDAAAVLGDVIERVSSEVDEELAVRSLLHKMVSDIEMLYEAELDASCATDISQNKTVEKHLSPSNSCTELSSIPPGEVFVNEEKCDLFVPNMKVIDSQVNEMDEQMLSADSESSSSDNEMDSDDDEMEVDNSYLFDQDSNLSDDSILSECSLASVVSICSFSSESDMSDDSSMSFHDDLVIDETVSNSQNTSSETVALPSESSPNSPNSTLATSCDLASKTTEISVSHSEDSNTKPESELLASAVLNSESSKVSFVETSLEETVVDLESDNIVPASQNVQPEDKLVSEETNNLDILSSSVIPNSETSNEISERLESEPIDPSSGASISSVEKTETVTLADETSSNKSCDMNSSKESAEIVVESVQEICTNSLEKSMDCSEALNSSESLIECNTNSNDSVLPKMPEIIFDSSETTESGKNGEQETVKTSVAGPTVDSKKKTVLSKKIPCYEDVISQYGIVFKDMNTGNFSKLEHKNFEDISEDSLKPSHLTHVRTVSWNPNFGSHFWLLSAGQSGITRLSYINTNQNIVKSNKRKK